MSSRKRKSAGIFIQVNNKEVPLRGEARAYLNLPGQVQEAIKAHIVERARLTSRDGLMFDMDATLRELVADALLAQKRGESMLSAVRFGFEDPGRVDEAQFQKYDVYIAPRDDKGGGDGCKTHRHNDCGRR